MLVTRTLRLFAQRCAKCSYIYMQILELIFNDQSGYILSGPPCTSSSVKANVKQQVPNNKHETDHRVNSCLKEKQLNFDDVLNWRRDVSLGMDIHTLTPIG